MGNNFELLKEKDNIKEEIKYFIDTTNDTIDNDKITTLITMIKQLLGYYNQLLARVQGIILDTDLSENIKIKEQIETVIKEKDNMNKLETLDNIYNQLSNHYNNLCAKVLSIIENNDNIIEYNNLIKRANDNIRLLNKLELPNSVLDELLSSYNKINSSGNIIELRNFVNKSNNIINKHSDNINNTRGDYNFRVFSLFAKINDQIIDSKFLKVNNLVYASYTLEDNSKYYAIIKDDKEIEALEQKFIKLPKLILTKDNIIKTCKIIIENAGIYYDINEYMRYIEKSYKNNMTKEIDTLIINYKQRLEILQKNLEAQLSFIDEIALLVNNKPSSKYPNIIYNDIKVSEYFSKDCDNAETLIQNILLNPNIKSEFDTFDILKTLYSENIINSLLTSNYISPNNTPLVNLENNIDTSNKNTNNIKKNSLLINAYLENRLLELDLLNSSSKINVTITKDNNHLFDDINTVLDLVTASVICDKVYKKGQGNYAVLDYLKTGNTLKFTSKYKARDLVNNLDRDNYLKLLLENTFKRYIYLKDSSSNNPLVNYVDSILTKDGITFEEIIHDILDNEELLSYLFTSFDYNLLNSMSDNYKNVEKITHDTNDLKIKKIIELLNELKKIKSLIK